MARPRRPGLGGQVGQRQRCPGILAATAPAWPWGSAAARRSAARTRPRPAVRCIPGAASPAPAHADDARLGSSATVHRLRRRAAARPRSHAARGDLQGPAGDGEQRAQQQASLTPRPADAVTSSAVTWSAHVARCRQEFDFSSPAWRAAPPARAGSRPAQSLARPHAPPPTRPATWRVVSPLVHLPHGLGVPGRGQLADRAAGGGQDGSSSKAAASQVQVSLPTASSSTASHLPSVRVRGGVGRRSSPGLLGQTEPGCSEHHPACKDASRRRQPLPRWRAPWSHSSVYSEQCSQAMKQQQQQQQKNTWPYCWLEDWEKAAIVAFQALPFGRISAADVHDARR